MLGFQMSQVSLCDKVWRIASRRALGELCALFDLLEGTWDGSTLGRINGRIQKCLQGVRMFRLIISSLSIFILCFACGEEKDDEPQKTLHRCVLPSALEGVDSSACIDYELSPLMNSQLETLGQQCTGAGGQWFSDAQCDVPLGTRGCRRTSVLVNLTTWYMGSFFDDDFWGEEASDTPGITNEAEKKQECEELDEEGDAGVWVTK